MNSVQKYEAVKHENINYLKPEKVGSSYFGSISYGKETKPLYIQTPKLRCLTNLNTMKNKKSPYLEVEIPNGKYGLYDFFLSLDDENIKQTVKNTNEWFGKEIPLEVIDSMYKRISQPFRKESNPKLKFQIPVLKQQIQCGIYNQQRVFQDISEVKENTEVVLVLHIRGLKILKHSFHCDCYVSQIKVYQPIEERYNIIKDYSIIDDEDDEGDIFSQEIKEAIEELKKEQEKEEQEKLDKQTIIQEEKQRILQEIEQKQAELEKLLNRE
jgi:hypothetical protein